ncbi:MAG: pyrroline-5-carboxylate reductase [Rhodobacteraceae bacterium]|jgi:BMFP domain-containing protein YqiC|nr:pyrroline-5-carboxylate reductase [Paracoccaceae bacterium]MBV03742.1 pyrroline-5-carboxylate reductase [Paracoccaceae bacterium]MDG1879655.1 accessory factor UbiK family protein [Paracoccaceae bacterium]MDG1940388.1 accessory factor UbiK family protein [Paracoccaceae bacterium]|tara:strand:+ start:945 stop:1199 length:255 start_codon:yes stop_codon:yes gene_type:complete
MQTRNKLFDDLSELMTNAMGVAQGAKDEADTAMKSFIERWISEKNLISREEFEVNQIMLQKALEENKLMKSRLELLEKKLKVKS